MNDNKNDKYPTAAGPCRMPAEWEPHAACFVLYPHNPATYPHLKAAQQQVLQFCHQIATTGHETVWLACPNMPVVQQVQQELAVLQQATNKNDDAAAAFIIVSVCPSNDTWARDTAPTFCVGTNNQNEPALTAIDWEFNGYGGPEFGAYWPCDLDQAIPKHICHVLGTDAAIRCQILGNNNNLIVQHQSIPLILEGGSIHTDGCGTMLTTAECLLHPSRNPTKTPAEIQDLVCRATNCTHMIWLPHGVAFDEDTNGHVDNFACFTQPGHVVMAWTDDLDQDAENYHRCREAEQILLQQRTAAGEPIVIHKLDLPSPPLFYTAEDLSNDDKAAAAAEVATTPDTTAVERAVGQRLAASYINFYIANRAVIVPQFGGSAVDTDQRAVATLQALFPDRTAVGVPSRAILLGGGNIHCMTQQIPAAAALGE